MSAIDTIYGVSTNAPLSAEDAKPQTQQDLLPVGAEAAFSAACRRISSSISTRRQEDFGILDARKRAKIGRANQLFYGGNCGYLADKKELAALHRIAYEREISAAETPFEQDLRLIDATESDARTRIKTIASLFQLASDKDAVLAAAIEELDAVFASPLHKRPKNDIAELAYWDNH